MAKRSMAATLDKALSQVHERDAAQLDIEALQEVAPSLSSEDIQEAFATAEPRERKDNSEIPTWLRGTRPKQKPRWRIRCVSKDIQGINGNVYEGYDQAEALHQFGIDNNLHDGYRLRWRVERVTDDDQ